MTGAENAPWFPELSEGPSDGFAVWRHTSDRVRLRIGIKPCTDARGTILLFPGRTEYIEKYGRVALDLIAAGYTVASIDWRGQGFSDRLLDDTQMGHVDHFQDYQLDVAQLVAAAGEYELPKPWFLLGHSMGGCIGLRALIEELPVERAVFSAPMWGLLVPTRLKPFARIVPHLARKLGRGLRYVPGTDSASHIGEMEFGDNMLTNDPDHYDYLIRQVHSGDNFALGGPSMHWFHEANEEIRRLYGLPRPEIPVLTFIGSKECIVDPAKIRKFHKNWPTAELRVIEGARHEPMMEVPTLRRQFIGGMVDFLDEAESD